MDALKLHAANQVCMFLHRLSSHKVRRAFYILVTQSDGTSSLKYILSAIVNRTGRRKMRECFSIWKSALLLIVKCNMEEEKVRNVKLLASKTIFYGCVRLSEKSNLKAAFSLWHRFVIEDLRDEAAESIKLLAGKTIFYGCVRLSDKSNLKAAFSLWYRFIIEDLREGHRSVIEGLREEAATNVKLMATSTLFHASVRYQRTQAMKNALGEWLSFVRQDILSAHSSTVQMMAAKTLYYGWNRALRNVLRTFFNQWILSARQANEKISGLRRCCLMLTKRKKALRCKKGLEALKSWLRLTDQVGLIFKLEEKCTLRKGLYEWRKFVRLDRLREKRKLGARKVARFCRSRDALEVHSHFARWLRASGARADMERSLIQLGSIRKAKKLLLGWRKWLELTARLGKVERSLWQVGNMLRARGLMQGWRNWIRFVFTTREKTMRGQYTTQAERTTLILARKVMYKVGLEKMKEGFSMWKVQVLKHSKQLILRLMKKTIMGNLTVAFIRWLNHSQFVLKNERDRKVKEKVLNNWVRRTEKGTKGAISRNFWVWRKKAETIGGVQVGMKMLGRCQRRHIIGRTFGVWWRESESLKEAANEKKRKQNIFRMVLRHRFATLYIEHMRCAVTAWKEVVRDTERESLEEKGKSDLLRLVVRHRLAANEAREARAGFAKWTRAVGKIKDAEELKRVEVGRKLAQEKAVKPLLAACSKLCKKKERKAFRQWKGQVEKRGRRMNKWFELALSILLLMVVVVVGVGVGVEVGKYKNQGGGSGGQVGGGGGGEGYTASSPPLLSERNSAASVPTRQQVPSIKETHERAANDTEALFSSEAAQETLVAESEHEVGKDDEEASQSLDEKLANGSEKEREKTVKKEEEKKEKKKKKKDKAGKHVAKRGHFRSEDEWLRLFRLA